jgi:protein-S-isoprenylcysteine O-methyltransferase Ste14
VRAIALLCYLLALAGGGALCALVLGLGLGQPRPFLELPCQWIINVTWLTLFAVQHSGMARDAFKARWTRLVPVRLERSVYAAVSGLLLLGLAATWQPLPGPLLWDGPTWLVVGSLLGGLGMVLVNLRFDHLGLFGLRQAWSDGVVPRDRLLIQGPYRFVRHPLMACLLLFLWAQPAMPLTLLLLNGGLSVYVLLGVVLEERDLLRRFGTAYADYQRRVPALLPWRWPTSVTP